MLHGCALLSVQNVVWATVYTFMCMYVAVVKAAQAWCLTIENPVVTVCDVFCNIKNFAFHHFLLECEVTGPYSGGWNVCCEV
jgi:hypothetical protein